MPNATLPSCQIISNFIRRVAFNVFCSCTYYRGRTGEMILLRVYLLTLPENT